MPELTQLSSELTKSKLEKSHDYISRRLISLNAKIEKAEDKLSLLKTEREEFENDLNALSDTYYIFCKETEQEALTFEEMRRISEK